ncbi:MAG TPA: metallopeptidase TldD-related protein [Thermoanaerobaculia bacterium]|nr:metallopeptidase TldD-related protein [Thermoanaerobaculia bacterium]
MSLDPSTVARSIEPLARQSGTIADVLVERRREVTVVWRDGEAVETRFVSTEALAARWQRAGEQRLVSLSRVDESGLREAVRELQTGLGRAPIPLRPAPATTSPQQESAPAVERWSKRLASIFSRLAPRHCFRWTLQEVARDMFPAGAPWLSHTRRLLSLEGSFTAASRRGDEARPFSFHSPESETTADELRACLARAAEPREVPTPGPEGETDAVLAAGSAVMLFHEILSHPLEAGSVSPLSGLQEARLAVSDLEVRDDATRLDLFGGYEIDDEGVRPRPVKLLDAGRLAGRLTSRASTERLEREASNGHGRRAEVGDPPLPRGSNVIVSAGGVTREEMARRLGQGLWIEEFAGGSVDLARGSFRLLFPRARRVRRGRLAEEHGPGMLAGEILPALRNVESGLGRETHPYRGLGWCSRWGQIVAVQGASPDVLIRQLAVRARV